MFYYASFILVRVWIYDIKVMIRSNTSQFYFLISYRTLSNNDVSSSTLPSSVSPYSMSSTAQLHCYVAPISFFADVWMHVATRHVAYGEALDLC